MAKTPRIFIASIATETNTFSPLRTDLRDFQDSFYAEPGQHPSTPTLCSAIFPVCRRKLAKDKGWTLIEGLATWAEPGGLVSQRTWETLRDQVLDQLEQALPVDAVLLGLHGAMVSQDCADCEGDLLSRVRQRVGPDVFVGATLDPHSHLSRARFESADALVAFKEFPHTDFVETAEQLVDIASRAILGEVRPRISVFDCRMIEIFPTSIDPMRGFVDRLRQLERDGEALSISVIHGFMAGDVYDIGAKIMVVTDDRRASGDRLARRLGMELFSFRGRTRSEFLDVESAVERALQSDRGPVVIADVWDNPGGGVPGDSTVLLKELLRQKVDNAALATIWDPIAVRTCVSAGEGATLSLRFGSKMAPGTGEPVDAVVRVLKVCHDAVQSFGASVVPLGDSVTIGLDGIEVILNTVRSQVFNPDIFSNMGIDPAGKAILAVKSTNHFYDAFARLTPQILYTAIDGSYPNDPSTNGYTRIRRPIWPLDDDPFALEEKR